jgi:flagellar assembly factor FliW
VALADTHNNTFLLEDIMVVNTAIFGTVNVDEENILHMPFGPFGFDEYKTFALLEQEDDGAVFRWLQSTEEENPCFVVFDPNELVADYRPEVENSDLRALGCRRISELKFYVIAVVPDDFRKTTVNLKSPIAVNPDTNVAMQVILANVDYPIRFPLLDEASMREAVGE